MPQISVVLLRLTQLHVHIQKFRHLIGYKLSAIILIRCQYQTTPNIWFLKRTIKLWVDKKFHQTLLCLQNRGGEGTRTLVQTNFQNTSTNLHYNNTC